MILLLLEFSQIQCDIGVDNIFGISIISSNGYCCSTHSGVLQLPLRISKSVCTMSQEVTDAIAMLIFHLFPPRTQHLKTASAVSKLQLSKARLLKLCLIGQDHNAVRLPIVQRCTARSSRMSIIFMDLRFWH